MQQEVEKLLGRKMKAVEKMAFDMAVDNGKMYPEIDADGRLCFKTFCECSTAMVQRDDDTQKAYCFECKKRIDENN
jgi:hypothetical protein